MNNTHLSQPNSSSSGYTGFSDSAGTPIRVGDSGKYRFMNFHVIRKGEKFFLEKWCRAYDLPLNQDSAREYTISPDITAERRHTE